MVLALATLALTAQAVHGQQFHIGAPVADFTLRDLDGRPVYTEFAGRREV